MNKLQAYPLVWPGGWRRTQQNARTRARFGERGAPREGSAWRPLKELSVMDALGRILSQLSSMGVDREEVVISTNVPTRLDGLPRSNTGAPSDPGAAVYWRKRRETRCMAIDRYDRVADNLAAIAATLYAMRAIERHGGAQILDRAFIGFKALPAPEQWWQVLGFDHEQATRDQILEAHLRLAKTHHPDIGGEGWQMSRINEARDRGLEELR